MSSTATRCRPISDEYSIVTFLEAPKIHELTKFIPGITNFLSRSRISRSVTDRLSSLFEESESFDDMIYNSKRMK